MFAKHQWHLKMKFRARGSVWGCGVGQDGGHLFS